MAKGPKIGKLLLMSIAVIASCLAAVWLWKGKDLSAWLNEQPQGPEYVINNYGPDIKSVATSKGLKTSYFMALCMLECGGRKPAPSRYEKHIFNRLMDVKTGQRESYELVKTEDLKNANGSAIKNLASSWGPFQVMGYKVVAHGILIKELRGPNGVKHGIDWIESEYGKLLQEDRFKDAFHFHNAGRVMPKKGGVRTHSKSYVSDGMKWMTYFEEQWY